MKWCGLATGAAASALGIAGTRHLHWSSAPSSGGDFRGGGEKLSPARAVQLLCRTRRDYAGLCVMKTKVSDRKALLHLAVYVNFLHLYKLFLQYQFLFYKEHIFCGPNELYICILH